MPKAAKLRTKARSEPLKATNSNVSKKPSQPKGRSKKADSTATSKNADSTATSKNVDSTATLNMEKPKPAEAIESYVLLVRLTCTDNPTITRLLSVPSNYNFESFHRVLQAAFGWAECHAHSFYVSKNLEEGEFPNFVTGRGKRLHIIQENVDDNLRRIYGEDNLDLLKDSAECTLADFYDSDEFRGKVELSYEYDHGDSWDHEIAFLGRADPTMRKSMCIPENMQAICLAGEGHPCAEDCGGEPGWEDLKAAFKKRADPSGKKDWYKHACANGDPKGLDPFKWNILEVNDELSKIKQ